MQRIESPPHYSRAEQFSPQTSSDQLERLCRDMISSLDAETRAAAADSVSLGRGTRLRTIASGTVYVFETQPPIDVSVGEPVVVRVGSREVPAVLTSWAEHTVELTLTADVGPTVSGGAELLVGAPWIMQRLKERVREVFEASRRTPRLFHLANALRTLGIGTINVQAADSSPVYENEKRPLNEAQVQAVDIAFRAPLSVIAAPAGTGKTLTIGAIVEAAYRAGLRTLVAAPSNVAVDLQMLQVCARLSDEEGFKSAGVFRLGAHISSDLRETYGENVVPDDAIAHLNPNLHARWQRAESAVDTFAVALKDMHRVSTVPDDPEVIRLRAKLADAESDLRDTREAVREFTRSLVAKARVVGATLSRVFLDRHLGMFDVVIIDEASMGIAPAVFIAAGLANRHVVLAGDPFQLAAPVRCAKPHRILLATDVFQRLGIIRALQDEESLPNLTTLQEQRRCTEDICELQRKLWYGESLRTGPEVIKRERARQNVIFGTQSLCYIDTSELSAKAYRPWGKTYANEQHARLIAELIAYLDSAGEIPKGGAERSEVLVLSPFRGQVAAIRKLLGGRYRGRAVDVRTVHGAQGAECTTCVFDLTLAPNVPPGLASILTDFRPEEGGSRLLAVAASRARSRFVVVGDLEWITRLAFARAGSSQSVLIRLCAHLQEHGYSIPVREIQPWRDAPHLGAVR